MLKKNDQLAPLTTGRSTFVIAGPCVLENEKLALETGQECQAICRRLGVAYFFKASYDKANRTSIHSYRGPGLEPGLRQLERIKEKLKTPVVTDVHETEQVERAAKVAEVIQVPAFLSTQVDLLSACGKWGQVINLKKAQFLPPESVKQSIAMLRAAGAKRIMATERGTCFGYNQLVVDMISLARLKQCGVPVIFDATHSVQTPQSSGKSSGGRAEFVCDLACAAAAVGVDGYYFEVHPNPAKALSDGATMVKLKHFEALLKKVLAFDDLARKTK